MKKLRKPVIGGVAAVAMLGALAACGEAPEESPESGSGGGEGGGSDYKPCIVSDAGGFDDRSFNQLGFEGITQAADELGVEVTEVESNSQNDFAPNLENLVAEGCTGIVSVGFALSAATIESANANPEIDYFLIDDAADADFDGEKDAENVKPLLYNTAEAAFLAGYAAADFSETGKVGTYGGEPFPTVTIFMDGFRQGVEYYNEEKGENVELVGWDGENGSFTGGFEEGPAATNTATQILDQDVDVIMPVGGPIYEGAVTAIADSNRDVALIGVDADLFETDPDIGDLVLTSVQKGMDVSTYEAVLAAGEGSFDGEPYVGTLENEGVGLAPFHDFESQISDSLAGELDDVRQQIIDGEITVESYLNQ
ncbi:BMP family ABC transporter substrate-binding protein [Nocardioides lentus]|uniref:BMP family ABC transporter substrate-binding protein n=1 Tax=Nocardioides lentus TaxID=338077 RepID=A0ABN2PMQ1_9ACTN